MSRKSREDRRQRRREERSRAPAVKEAPPAPGPERAAETPAEPAIREVPAAPPAGLETVPAAHLLEPKPATSPGVPVDEPPTAPTRREEVRTGKPSRPPKARASEAPAARKKKPASEVRKAATKPPEPATKAAVPAPAPPKPVPPPAPVLPKPPPPPASAPKPAPAPARPDESSGTLASFVSATRRLINKWTGAPPEVRITLPSGDLKLFRLNGDIDDRLALQAATWMLFVQAMKSDADLTVLIDSTGGSLTAGLSLIDVMLKATCRVRTHCVRQAQGIASFILAAGTKGYRTITRASLLTVPGDGRGVAGITPRILGTLATATGRSAAQVEKEILTLRAVTPKLAVRHGLADAVAV